MIYKALCHPFHRRRLDRASEAGKLYQVYIEKDSEFKPSQYNNFFDSLYTIYNPKAPHQWVTMEFWAKDTGIRLYAWLAGGVEKGFLQANLNSVHPSAEVVEAGEDFASVGRLYGKDVCCATLELDGHYLFNLLQSDGERVGADMMTSLCASLQNLDEAEEVAVQFLLRPVGYNVLKIADTYYELYKKFGRRPSRLHYPLARFNPYLEVPKALVGAVKHTLMGSAGARENHLSTTSIQKKLEAGVFFDLAIRVVTSHPVFGKAKAKMNTVLSAFAPATDKNRLRPYTNYGKRRDVFLKTFEARRIPTYPLENYVTPAELATLLHYPNKDIPNVVRLRAKKLPVPEGVITYNTVSEAWKDGAIVFGVSNFRGRIKYLAFRDTAMLMQHLYCIGGTGSGKSFWLSFLALQVARHAGFTFFDVKGDIADELIRHLPKEDWDRVFYVDLQEDLWYFPFNVLRNTGMSVYNLASLIISVFMKAFSEGSIREKSQDMLRQALIAVISTNSEASLLEVYRIFTDEAYLDWTIAQMQKGTEYPDVLDYWKNTYKRMKATQRRNECSAILNKLKVITQNERPRYTMCQKENILHWRKMMDEKAIVIVNFALDKNTDEIVSFFGTMFTAFISQAIFSRGDTLVKNRVPHVLFLDEFEMFVDQGEDMKRFLELARSYGLGLVLAHQSVSQLENAGSLLGMIKDNTYTQVSLLVGEKSAPEIAKMLQVDSDDLTSMEEYTGFGRFRKLSPNPFTFDNVDMREHFPAVEWDALRKWKEGFKRKHYRHKLTIKDDINARYALVEKNQIQDEDSPRVKAGNASGRLRKGANGNESQV